MMILSRLLLLTVLFFRSFPGNVQYLFILSIYHCMNNLFFEMKR